MNFKRASRSPSAIPSSRSWRFHASRGIARRAARRLLLCGGDFRLCLSEAGLRRFDFTAGNDRLLVRFLHPLQLRLAYIDDLFQGPDDQVGLGSVLQLPAEGTDCFLQGLPAAHGPGAVQLDALPAVPAGAR